MIESVLQIGVSVVESLIVVTVLIRGVVTIFDSDRRCAVATCVISAMQFREDDDRICNSISILPGFSNFFNGE